MAKYINTHKQAVAVGGKSTNQLLIIASSAKEGEMMEKVEGKVSAMKCKLFSISELLYWSEAIIAVRARAEAFLMRAVM